MARRRSKLTQKQAADLDGKIYSELFSRWMAWETRARPGVPPPCPTGIQFRRFLPASVRNNPFAAATETNASVDRLKGRRLVRNVPNKWRGGKPIAPGEGLPNYCLVPIRPDAPILAGGHRRKKPRRN